MLIHNILLLKHVIILFQFSLTVKCVYSVHAISISPFFALHFLDKSAAAVGARVQLLFN